MRFELWSAASGNRIGTFDGIEELGAVVREFAEANGENAIANLFAEGWAPLAQTPAIVLTGHDLLTLASPLVRTYASNTSSSQVQSATSSRQVRSSRLAIAV